MNPVKGAPLFEERLYDQKAQELSCARMALLMAASGDKLSGRRFPTKCSNSYMRSTAQSMACV